MIARRVDLNIQNYPPDPGDSSCFAEQDMNELYGILGAATAGVARAYFQLDICGGDPVFRERVYCYELYHQMRLRWPTNGEYVLNGEIDKGAHPILMKLGKYPKPDFLVHTPGKMDCNYAIIEVKHSTAKDGIQKDLKNLDLFVRKLRYKRAIYLFFGCPKGDEVVKRIAAVASEFKKLVPIEIWLHSAVNQQATLDTTLPQ